MTRQRHIALTLLLLGILVLQGRGALDPARAQSGPAPVEQLVETVSKAPAAQARAAAAERLGLLGTAAEGAVPVLVEVLGWDLAPEVRGRAAEALGRLGAITAEVVPALIEAIEANRQLLVRWRAVEALERIGAQTRTADAGLREEIGSALIATLQGDPYPGVRARAAEALGVIHPESAAAVPALIEAFQQDTHPGVRWQAAAALEGIAVHYKDDAATEAIADLKKALAALAGHPHPEVQRNAEGLRQAIRQLEARQGS
ncbi:MAG: HEAT repeat domain-containing protein [Kiloniellaceae bacterium]